MWIYLVTSMPSEVKKIFANQSGFAALRHDGLLVSWGDPKGRTLSDVDQVASTSRAWAALCGGRVVTWGHEDHGASAAASELRGVRKVYGNRFAFAAVLAGGQVAAWGPKEHGGDCGAVAAQLSGVQHIEAASSAFAAITLKSSVDAKRSGVQVRLTSTVVAWGDPRLGGDSSGASERKRLGKL